MIIERREFLKSAGVAAAAATATACGVGSPTGPTEAPQLPVNTPPPAPPPNPSSPYGNFYRSGTAGINGTLEEILRAAQLSPELNNVGLLVRLNGREAPLPAGANPNNGGYVVHVNGKWIGSGSAREILLSRGDTWDLFDWNGRNP